MGPTDEAASLQLAAVYLREFNEAAADVFGEVFVQVANIFGAVYGAATGGTFGMDGAAEAGASTIDPAITAVEHHPDYRAGGRGQDQVVRLTRGAVPWRHPMLLLLG